LDDFIAGRIRFTDMAPAVEHALALAAGEAGFAQSPRDLDEVLHWDGFARRAAAQWQGAA
ncbi:1-deoxy-D-xylulose-5-phosphate reductoisomerase, partial [Paracoccus sp. PXZ]